MRWDVRGKNDVEVHRIEALIQREKAVALQVIVEQSECCERTVQRYLKVLHGMSSFTHGGQYVTLPEIPRFDDRGIWFCRKVGFSSAGNSLATIIKLIATGEGGFTREELEDILRIGISKQIQILLQRGAIQRVKLGSKYLYLPKTTLQNKKKILELVGTRQAEVCFEKEIQKTDLIALLKVVLIEKKVAINAKSIQTITRKYALKIPERKVELLLRKYDLPVKKKL
jgi:hypothetical protein